MVFKNMCKQWGKTDEISLTEKHKSLFDISKVVIHHWKFSWVYEKAGIDFSQHNMVCYKIQFNNIQQVFSVLSIYALKIFSSADFGVQTTNLFLNLIY